MVNINIDLEGKTVLVTGAAGFIGSNLVKRLFRDVKDIRVVGIDSITATASATSPMSRTSLRYGLRAFARWYARCYGVGV